MKNGFSLGNRVLMGALLSVALQLALIAQEATPNSDGNNIHIFPTYEKASGLAAPLVASPLLYHSGGVVMQKGVTVYTIFWVPAKLQTGASTGMSSFYQMLQKNMVSDYAGHGIGSNNTQYYQIVGGVTQYIQNKGGFGASVVDTDSYPSSDCKDTATPGNCITDAQLRTEILKVMSANKWSGGLNKVFMVFTSSGEGSCFDSSNKACAYTQYCGYHSFIGGSTPVIYTNQPYGNTSSCQAPGTPSPNGFAVGDAATSIASHELTESTTDPELNAWFDSKGNEIGDKCAYVYGTNTWDSSKANEMWNGHFYELQTEFDNHLSGCVQVGP